MCNQISATHFNKTFQLTQHRVKQNITVTPQVMQKDTFSRTNESKESESKNYTIAKFAAGLAGLAVLGGIAYKVIKSRNIKSISSAPNHKIIPNKYRQALAQGVSGILGRDIKEEALSSVMTREEFLNVLPTLKKENYVANSKNICDGIFRADLHSHTVHSDGKISVKDFLDEVSTYSEQVYNKTKKNVIFSITDHDTMEGNKEALCIIAQNPEKFKHVKFITGSEISFMHKATEKNTNPVETSEVLVYGFNPFSEKVSNFFNNVKTKRETMMNNYISDLSSLYPFTKFSKEEFLKFYPQSIKLANSHWKLNHYGQTKRTLHLTAEYKKRNSEEYYSEIMSKVGKKNSLGELKQQGLVENWIDENEYITNIRKKYEPKIKNDKLTGLGENKFEEIVEAFDDADSVLGFAHPYYLSERIHMNEIPEMIDNMISKSKGLFKLTESHHQAYRNDKRTTLQENINKVNEIMESKGLIPLGGRDNHDAKWLG